MAKLAPSIPVLQFHIARIAMLLGQTGIAKQALHLVIREFKTNKCKYYYRAAEMFRKLSDLDAARECLEEAKRAHPASPRLWVLLGELCRDRGDADDAECCFNKALALASSREEQCAALGGLAGCFTDTARKDDAKDIYNRIIKLAPDRTDYRYLLVLSDEHITPSDDVAKRMIEMLELGRLRAEERMNLHFSLGMIFDRHRMYGEAFAHFMLANAIRARRAFTNQLERKEHLDKFTSDITCVFTKELIAQLSQFGDSSDFLVCIVGMPRSGTTLLEQILSSHPGVKGLGERLDFQQLASGVLQARLGSRHPYPMCCRSMSSRDVQEISHLIRKQLCQLMGSSSRVVTKLPADAWSVGLIKILFPNAKIIHSRRHPIDTCLSCYMQNFRFLKYATNLDDLASVYRSYRSMMAHWGNVLGDGQMLDVFYENLVAEPDPVVRGLHDFCGLPHDENWFKFSGYVRRVETMSMWQVRRPIYQSSVQKWKKYASYLGPLLEL